MKETYYVVAHDVNGAKTAAPRHMLSIDALEELLERRKNTPLMEWNSYRVTTEIKEIEIHVIGMKRREN